MHAYRQAYYYTLVTTILSNNMFIYCILLNKKNKRRTTMHKTQAIKRLSTTLKTQKDAIKVNPTQ